MQETTRADLRQLEVAMTETQATGTANHVANNPEKDPARALQIFLDRITINSSIPGIQNARVVELKTGDTVKDAIELLYTTNTFGAPIANVLDPNRTVGTFSDRYVGFINFATMVLWSLEKCETARVPIDGHASEQTDKSILFSLLEQNPEIGHTKVGELAKSFLWNPFFPVRLEDTLFHVLLLLSKHPVQVVPVIERSDLQVIGFVSKLSNSFFNPMDLHGSTVLQTSLYQNFGRENPGKYFNEFQFFQYPKEVAFWMIEKRSQNSRFTAEGF